jgi:hypothetical protein
MSTEGRPKLWPIEFDDDDLEDFGDCWARFDNKILPIYESFTPEIVEDDYSEESFP